MIDKSEENTNKSIRIYDDLLEKIIQLEYMPGEKISENELSSLYHTTRHSVRGALSRLKEKGFVDIIPQSGTFVSLLDIEHLKQALFIREAVEQEVFYEIITNGIDRKFLKKMKKNLERQKEIIEFTNDLSRFYQMNDEFHFLQLEAIGKIKAMSMLKDAHMHTQRWRKIGFDMINQIDAQIADHEAIIKAIETKDWRMGRDAIHKHISFLIQYSEKIMARYPKYFA